MKTPSAMRAAAVVAAVAASVLSPSLAEMPDSLVEYVEATGTQYIDTGITGRHGTRVDMKFVVTTQKESWMMGSRSTSSSRDRIFPCYLYGTSIDIGYGSSYNRTWWTYSVGATYMLQTDFTDEGVVKATRNGSAANDKLPKRLTDIPQDPKRPDTRVPLEQMKKTYYRARGWEKNGLPSEKKLKQLGIR